MLYHTCLFLLSYLECVFLLSDTTINSCVVSNAFTCRGSVWKPCRFSSDYLTCGVMHFEWRLSPQLSCSASLSHFLLHSLTLCYSLILYLSFSLWGITPSWLVLSWDHFSPREMTAGPTSPHPVSVYFNINILGVEWFLYLQKTCTDLIVSIRCKGLKWHR